MALSLSFARAPLVRGGFLVLAFRFSDVASKRDSPPSLFFFLASNKLEKGKNKKDKNISLFISIT